MSAWEDCNCWQCEAAEEEFFSPYDTREEEELDRELAGFNEPERWVEREDYA